MLHVCLFHSANSAIVLLSVGQHGEMSSVYRLTLVAWGDGSDSAEFLADRDDPSSRVP